MIGLEILGALGGLSAFIDLFRSSNDQINHLDTNAFEKLNEAVTETERYFYLKKGKSANAEHRLNRVWSSASYAFNQAGYPDMAGLCKIKGQYWLDPAGWTEEEITKSGIELNKMRIKLDEALQIN